LGPELPRAAGRQDIRAGTMKLTAVTTELIRAANNIERISLDERRRLLGRAYVTIVEARTELGSLDGTTPGEPALHVVAAVGHADTLSDNDVKDLLLDAATMIRTIKIVLDKKVGVTDQGLKT